MSYLKKYKTEAEAFLKVCHQLSEKMYVTAYGGNLAWRLEPEVILITPTKMNKGEIRPDDLVFINSEGETIEGTKKPTGEKYMYLKFFKERPDVVSVIHCHAPSVCAFAVMEEDYLMKPWYPELTHEVGPVPMVPYAEPISPKLADNFSDYLQKYNTFLMENHGVVSMSPLGIDWTHMNIELLEMSALSLIQALATGVKLKTLSKEEVRNLDNVVKKRSCPMFGAPGVHESLVDLYFPEE
ncbi:MAG: class II aldolase/adducin family protein [Prolixibacteraceae bacterium]